MCAGACGWGGWVHVHVLSEQSLGIRFCALHIHYDYHYWICVSLSSNTLLWCVNCRRLKYIMIIITGSVLA